MAVGFALLHAVLATASDDDVTTIVEHSKQAVSDADTSVVPQGVKLESDDFGWLRQSGQTQPLQHTERAGGTPQARAWREIEKAAGGDPAMAASPQHPAPPEDVVYVFISLAMPERALSEMFAEVLTDRSLPPVIFVLRGWHPPDIGGVVRALNALFPEKDKLRMLPNVQIDPVLFRNNDVVSVPTFVARKGNGMWGRQLGSSSVSKALRNIDSGLYAEQAAGEVFDIEEPDILALIEQKMAAVDWSQQVEAAKKKVFERTTGAYVAQATDSYSYDVDLTIQVRRDLAGPSGETFASAGQTINPLDHMSVQRRYVFFDASSAGQRSIAKDWVEANPYVTLISTLPLSDPGAREEMLRMFGQPVFESNPALIRRFMIREVPAIVYQNGTLMRVDVRGVSRAKRL